MAKAEAETNTAPTDAQKEAGNYKKGHVRIDGFDITIENPKGSERSGTDATGKKWSHARNNTYGYIRGTEGVDGDHIDVFCKGAPMAKVGTKERKNSERTKRLTKLSSEIEERGKLGARELLHEIVVALSTDITPKQAENYQLTNPNELSAEEQGNLQLRIDAMRAIWKLYLETEIPASLVTAGILRRVPGGARTHDIQNHNLTL